MGIQLTEVRRLPDERRILFSWADGHSAEFENDYLRGFCPCAGCQGHGTGIPEFRAPAAPVDAVSIQPVGNYAISILWSDGHSTGIYRFEYLRSLCPCPECSATRESQARTE